MSVKAIEREMRGNTRGTNLNQVLEGRAVPPWQKFLSISGNKTALANHLGEFISANGPAHTNVASSYKEVVISGAYADGTRVVTITSDGAKDEPGVAVSHEEADTRIVLHMIKADELFGEDGHKGRIVIQTPDADVLVNALHYFPQVSNTEELWLETGPSNKTSSKHRFIAMHEISQVQSPILPKILPAVHAITGCVLVLRNWQKECSETDRR